MRYFLIALSALSLLPLNAQFHPPAGQAGSSAIFKDSSIITAWANQCTSVRGYMNIDNTGAGFVTAGSDSNVVGQADGFSTLSLGDGGYAIVRFASTVYNGPGYDIAVFENSFNDDFLELAFVEVSSDGINFYRFPATSNVQDTLQTGTFGLTNATHINNLAGKYRMMYGTPFDLDELNGTPGLDVDAISHIKIIDVTGSLLPQYATTDQYGHPVNDPWPTEFAQGGFDLEAVAAMYVNPQAIHESTGTPVQVFPNPARDYIIMKGLPNEENEITLFSISGAELYKISVTNSTVTLNTEWLERGMYVLRLVGKHKNLTIKIILE